MKYILLLAFVATTLAQKDAFQEWVYEEDNNDLPGPSKWASKFPECAVEGQQSPINVISAESKYKRFPDRQPRNWNISMDLLLENNGESLRFTYIPDSNKIPLLKGGPMPEGRRYQFYLGYFYFGKDDNTGSAHQVDGKSKPLEVVLYEVGDQNDEGKAPQEMAAVSVLFDVSEEDNEAFQPVIDALKEIQKPGWARARVDSLLAILINKDKQKWSKYRNNYYHYIGTSLTPPCERPVWWILLQDTNYIGKNQIAELRKLTDANGNPLAGKVRAPQPIASRPVYHSEKFESDLTV